MAKKNQENSNEPIEGVDYIVPDDDSLTIPAASFRRVKYVPNVNTSTAGERAYARQQHRLSQYEHGQRRQVIEDDNQ